MDASRTIQEQYPKSKAFNDPAVPDRALAYLTQAINSIHAPAASVVVAASAVDSMLKAKAYKDGNLYSRINQAVKDHLITKEMGEWAHEVRLDANNQRHADDGAPLPTEQDAQRVIEFAMALAQFLFILPAMVAKGRKSTTHKTSARTAIADPESPPVVSN